MKRKVPQWGDKRVRKVFFWWPKEVNNVIYWLETHKVEEFYRGYHWFMCRIVDDASVGPSTTNS